MNLLLWVIFGALVGWIASLLMGTDAQQGLVLNIVVGVIGAFLGGTIMNFFGASAVTGFNLYSFVVALIGSIVLIAIVQTLRGGSALRTS